MANKKFGNHNSNAVVSYVYGRIPTLNSIENKKAKKVYLQTGFSDAKILNAIKESKVPYSYLPISELDRLSNKSNHQGVLVEVKEYQYSSLDEIIKSCKNKPQPLVLILDGIEDPHNLGAIIRCADAFSVDGIIMKEKGQAAVNMTVQKVSTGAADFVKIAQVSNLSNAIRTLKDNGFWVYASDGSAKEDYSKVNFDGAIALIVGSEGFGISRLVLENSDFIIKIPMSGHVNSLNVSVATGILLSRVRNK